jgi:hypothetical protein
MTTIIIGKGLSIEVDKKRIRSQAEARDHVENIGLRNILMDAHANVKREDYELEGDYRAAKLALAQKKLDGLYNGNVRTNAASVARAVDPVEAAAMRMARVFVNSRAMGKDKADWFKAWGEALEMPFGTEDEIKALKAAAIAARAEMSEVIDAAKAEVAAQSTIKVGTGGLAPRKPAAPAA